MIKEISYITFGRDGHDTGNSARDPRHPEVPGALHRLAEMDGEKPAKKKFKKYPIGYFHIDIAEVRTEEGQLSLFVVIDRTSKFAYAELHEQNR